MEITSSTGRALWHTVLHEAVDGDVEGLDESLAAAAAAGLHVAVAHRLALGDLAMDMHALGVAGDATLAGVLAHCWGVRVA
jgi:hypothetical protein